MTDDLTLAARVYAGTLKAAGACSATASAVAQDVARDEFQSLSESAVIALAKDVLRDLRLTTFDPRTKADAVAVIRGIRGRKSNG
jgi:hypothetical protein